MLRERWDYRCPRMVSGRLPYVGSFRKIPPDEGTSPAVPCIFALRPRYRPLAVTTNSMATTPGKPDSFLPSHVDGRSHQFFADSASALAMVGDFSMIVFGLVLGFWMRFQSSLIPLTWGGDIQSKPPTLYAYAKLIGLGAIILFATLLNSGLYRRQNLLRFRQVVRIFVGGTCIWLLIFFAVNQVVAFNNPSISRIYVLCSYIAVNISVLTWRMVFHRLLQNEAAAQGLRQKILVIGWNKHVTRLVESIHADKSHPYHLVGFLNGPDGDKGEKPPPGIQRFGDYDQLHELMQRESIHIVVLADADMALDEVISLSNLCERELIQFKVIPSYFQILVSGLQLETISGVPIMGVSALPLDHPTHQFVKRVIDITGSLVGLILSAPIMLVCGCLIYRESPGPIFYSQVRTGRNGRSFRIYKLRSMKLDAEKAGTGWSTKNDDRRLKIGSALRNLNLDEVPQFWNVLKGDMSLVGPRPERPELIAKFRFDIPHYNARLASKPGITGWAQVNGLRGDTDLAERVKYDIYYLENWTPILDFYIMFLTFVRRENAY